MTSLRTLFVIGIMVGTLTACGPTTGGGDDDPGQCSVANGGCDAVNAMCDDSTGSVVCTCNDGFETGDGGATCTDIDECADNFGGCDPIRGTCTESATPGAPPICGCPDGQIFESGSSRCECDESNAAELPYLWVANSPQGTVSKVETETIVERARYYTGPVGRQDPSRTSVSLDGRYMVVVNRNGGISMIAANMADCVDTNMSGSIETSTGPADILPWGTDECVIWNVELPFTTNTNGPRPVAWTLAPIDPDTCNYEVGNVWVGWYTGSATNIGHFRLIDGATGATINEVTTQWGGATYGPYGGAIDAENNLWVVGWGNQGIVIKIDATTHQITTHANQLNGSFYGMGLAPDQSLVIGGCDGFIYHFDTENTTWHPRVQTNSSCLRGLQVDPEGRAWIAKNAPCGLLEYDTETRTIINQDIVLPGCSTPVGVSVDQDGFVWVVDQGGFAFKVDRVNYTTQRLDGLVSPYTYSDMIGTALRLQGPVVD